MHCVQRQRKPLFCYTKIDCVVSVEGDGEDHRPQGQRDVVEEMDDLLELEQEVGIAYVQ